MGSGQYKPNKLSQLLRRDYFAVFVYVEDWFFRFVLLPSLESEFFPSVSRPIAICETVVVFAEDGLQKDCKSSHLLFLQMRNTASASQYLQAGRQ